MWRIRPNSLAVCKVAVKPESLCVPWARLAERHHYGRAAPTRRNQRSGYLFRGSRLRKTSISPPPPSERRESRANSDSASDHASRSGAPSGSNVTSSVPIAPSRSVREDPPDTRGPGPRAPDLHVQRSRNEDQPAWASRHRWKLAWPAGSGTQLRNNLIRHGLHHRFGFLTSFSTTI